MAGPYPSAGPRLRSAVIGRRANLLPATNVTFQEKTVPLGKFNVFHFFKGSTNGKGELDVNSLVSVKETWLGRTKKE